MQRIPVPCKDCPDRHYKCHSECEKYAEYDRINKEIREEKKKLAEQKEFDKSVASKLQQTGRSLAYQRRHRSKYGR